MYTLTQIAALLGGTLTGGHLNGFITHLSFDSRKLHTPCTTLFFALRGLSGDGHQFIGQAYKAGVRMFVVRSLPADSDLYESAGFIVVSDTTLALQALAAHHRRKFNLPVIAITGSNGKTIVKEWLFQLLNEDINIVRNPRSYNSQIGVPLSLWQISDQNALGIFEAGISMKGEMEKLEKIIRPTIGLFTNIGDAHQENFSSTEEKISEKLKLFPHVDLLVYCQDHMAIHRQITQLLPGVRTFNWSAGSGANLHGVSHRTSGTNTLIEGTWNGEQLALSIPFTDHASIENAVHCLALCLAMGKEPLDLQMRFENLTPVAMRLELLDGIQNCTVINDSYNSDRHSLAIALDVLARQTQRARHTVILSDILQSGTHTKTLYQSVGEQLNSKHIHKFIGIGRQVKAIKNHFQGEMFFYDTTAQFMQQHDMSGFSGEAILVKGARPFGFELISARLQQKKHETVLEIDLDALVGNLNYIRTRLQPATSIMAMVKAFSYGSGSYEIASVLQYHRVDYLAVAYADEGVELRKSGITLPVMVMNPEESSFDVMTAHRLEPEIYSFRILEAWLRHVRKSDSGERWKVHIKLDTGMHRLGFVAGEEERLARELRKYRQIIWVASIFSHLAAADDPALDHFTRQQIQRFEKVSSHLIEVLGYTPLRHVLNSAGILRFPEAQYDMVRPGIGLYGIGEAEELRQVSTLKTSVTQIKKVPAGETIGYNRAHLAQRDMVIAILPIGYADGLFRSLGNENGQVMIKGHPVSIVGNVCMDMCMVDVTEIDVQEGDTVIVFGKGHPIANLSSKAGTIPYEILTGISQRVKRTYFQE